SLRHAQRIEDAHIISPRLQRRQIRSAYRETIPEWAVDDFRIVVSCLVRIITVAEVQLHRSRTAIEEVYEYRHVRCRWRHIDEVIEETVRLNRGHDTVGSFLRIETDEDIIHLSR